MYLSNDISLEYCHFRYTSFEPKGGYKSNDPFNIYESIWSNLNINNNTNSSYNRISSQTIESLDNYICDKKGDNKNNDLNVHIDYTDNVCPKFVANTNLKQLLNTKNLIKNDECYEDNLEIGPCYCKNWNIFAVTQVADTLVYENSNLLEKSPAYPKEIHKESPHRLINIKNKAIKSSFDSYKHSEYFDQSRHNMISLKKRRKGMTSSKERELLEMKALRAYNEITLMEDKREMEKKKQPKTDILYSFIDNTKSWSTQVMSCSKMTNNHRQIQRRNEADSFEFNTYQDHFDSYNEIEIHNTTDSFFEYVSNINNEELIKEKENLNYLENESSSSRLPNIQNKDAAIMLNLLDRHGSHWFRQELRRILTIRDSQVYMKHSKPNQDAMKLNLSLRNSEKITDSLELGINTGREDMNIPFGLPSSYQYLRTDLDFGSNKNFKTFNSTESIISERYMPTNSSDLKDFIECTENKKVNEKEDEKIQMIDTPKEFEIEEIEKFKIDMLDAEKDNSSFSLTNSISFSSIKKTENVVESIDDRNHHQVRRRNMSRHMIDIARNIHWSLRPHGILLTNKNLQGMNFESSDLYGNQQRDIVDDVTASLVHAAFSHKPEIIIRTFPRDSRSINDEGFMSFFENFYNIYRLPSTVDEFVFRSDNDMDIYVEDTLTFPNIQDVEDDVNDLDDILQGSCDSMETDRNFDLCILVMEDEDLPLDSRSTSTDSFPTNEVVQYDSEVTIALSETRTMDIVDPEIDSLGCETIKDSDQPSLEMIIAFFSFLLAFYLENLGSYFLMSDLHNSVYAYRPYEMNTDMFKNNFSDDFLPEKCDMVVSSNSINISEFIVEPGNQERNGVIDFIDEVEEDDQASIKSTNSQISNIRDSIDTMYTKNTVESAISIGENSSMEEFS